ncbi:MAG: phosphoribosylamine--glycine ligase [Nitrososphaerales archaeon]
MKILGIGNGAREHAIAEKLCNSKYNPKIYWITDIRNPGLNRICKETNGELLLANTLDAEKVGEIAERLKVDFAFVGPEEPNFYGIPDELERRKIPCIGASKDVAIIEQSKAMMRRLQWEYDLPGKLLFKTFKSSEEAYQVLKNYENTLTWLQNVALKPARQAGGKGVKVVEDRQIYLHEEKSKFKSFHVNWLENYMKSYSDIDDKILVEENVWGPEYTLQCFVDGKTLIPMPMVQDNKNAHDFDIGTETGGMGSIAGPKMFLSFMKEEEFQSSVEIVKGMVKAIQDRSGKKYKGIVAGQMMMTEVEGPTIIEMYSRLGDPEALNVLSMLKSDLVDICYAIIEERLSKIKVEFKEIATVVKAIAPKGYPDFRNLAKNHPVQVDEESIIKNNCKLFWGSCELKDGELLTAGSRLLEILAEGEDMNECSERINKCMSYVKLKDGWGLYYRSDIGSKELLERREKMADRARRLYQYRIEKGILGKRVDWLPKIGKIDPVRVLRDELKGNG